ncbi:MAG: alpha/beta fold hydrolase [Bacillota bacterium]
MSLKLDKIKVKTGEVIAYRERKGTGKKLVLIHGNMTSSKHWDILMETLPEDWNLLAPDMRGFGQSTYKNRFNSLNELAHDIIDLLQKKDFYPCSLLGWSTGGGVAMEIAAEKPEQVSKLILLESVSTRGYPIYKKDEKGQPIYEELLTTKEEIANDPIQVQPVFQAQKNNDKETMREIWDNLIYTKNKPSRAKYEEYLEDMMTQRNLIDIDYALASFNISNEHNGVAEGSGKADSIEAPTLILQGDRDMVVPQEMAQTIKKDLGDIAEIKILSDCGHSPLIDDLEQLTAQITSFLEE